MIAAIVYPMIEMQKAYGRKLDPKLVMQGWQGLMADRFSGEQVCYALRKYATEVGDDFPSPKNLIDILNPEEPRVTDTEYNQAVRYQERHNWPMMSEAQDVIDLYRKQNFEKREVFKIENEQVRAIAASSIKRIEA
jgi:hypothetical protein